MWGIVLVFAAVLALIPLVVWIVRTDFLLRCAGVDATFVKTVPDRARYISTGAIVLLTATAATASLTVALSLVFSGRDWYRYLPVGLLWGAIVLNFDRWIVSNLDYGPLAVGEGAYRRSRRTGPKVVHFLVRFALATLVGLVISEPIVLAVFGPEISQQLAVQHASDINQQTTQINAQANRQIAALAGPLNAAQHALAKANRAERTAHKIYLCELTAKCHLPQGEITGVAGLGPQTTQDYQIWRHTQREQAKAQQALAAANGTQQHSAKALRARARAEIATATARINADNGLLARERALDTLSRQNSGFLLRRVLLWLALMFIDLVPVLLKTFSPPTVADYLQRAAAVKIARNAMSDAMDDSDHESKKLAITREHDLEYHRAVVAMDYDRRMEAARAGVRADGTSPAANGTNPAAPAMNGSANGVGRHRAGHNGASGGDGATAGWVIGGRWMVQRPMADVPHSGRIPFVATDLQGAYPFEVVVKIIAPPPKAGGPQALKERRRAQMEMSLPVGHLHDNIAEMLDCDLDPENGFYIVTRLYPTTLDQYLREVTETDSLTVGKVLDIAVQILDGLRAAWDRGFVHLDLKPTNVALTEEGTVKLIDFGLAQHFGSANGGNDTTMTPRFTPFYAPPEQMLRQGSWISRNADIRALGAVIYRMLTGYPPLFREAYALKLVDASGRHESYTDIRDLISTVEPIPVTELVSYVPEDLDALLRQWLRIDPQMRSPGKPDTMAQRAWWQLTAVLDRVSAGQEARFLAGPRVAHAPRFTRLRAEWRPGPSRHAGTGPAKSGDTVEGPPAGLLTVPGPREAETLEPGTAPGPARAANGDPDWDPGVSTEPAPEGYLDDEDDR